MVLKATKNNIPAIKKQAFQMAKDNMIYITRYKIQNKEYYDKLYYFKFIKNNVKKSA